MDGSSADVAVVLRGADSTTSEAVEQACLAAGLRCLPADESRSAALVVAPLRAAERRVPDEVVDFLSRRSPDALVLLLASEPLLRPTVSVPGGRITLMGPPHSAARLATRLRALVGDRELDSGDRVTTRPQGMNAAVITRQYRARGWWTGTVAAVEPPADHIERKLPTVRQEASEGLTVVLSTRAAVPKLDDVRTAAGALLRSESDAQTEMAVRDALGAGACIVQLTGDRKEWVVHWGEAARPIWLLSPMRLPAVWDLRRSLGSGAVLRMSVERGDMLVAMSEPVGGWAEAPTSGPARPFGHADAELAAALLDGGPSALELLAARLRKSPASFSAAFVEVR
jgi:hypothetical protein